MKKSMIINLFCFCLMTGAILSNAHATTLDCLSTKDSHQINRFKGSYIATDLLNEVKKTKLIFDSQTTFLKKRDEFSQAIAIDEAIETDGAPNNGAIMLTNWHEGPTTDDSPAYCVTAKTNEELALYKNGKFQAIYKKLPYKVDAYLYNVLFNACYHDEMGTRICIKDNTIVIKDTVLKAKLILDSSELFGEGNYVKVEGEPLFWVFVPTADGWDILKSDFASKDNFKPADISKPWKKLRLE